MELRRKLGLPHLIFITIGIMIGTGIFIIPPYAVEIAGSSSLFAWIGIGTLSILTSLILAELSGAYTGPGGIFLFARKAFGELWGFLVGWCSWIVAWVTIGVLVGGGLSYLTHLVPLSEPTLIILSTLFIGGLTLVSFFQIELGAKVQAGLTGLMLFLLSIFLILGLPKVDLSNLVLPEDIQSTLLAATIIIEPYIIWEVIFLSGETKNPKKNVPKALILSSVLVSFLYFTTAFVTLGTGKISLLKVSELLFGGFGKSLLTVLALGLILSSTNSWIMSSARIPFAMARDFLLPSTFAKLSKRGVPKNVLITQFIIVTVIAASGTYKELLRILVPFALLMYIIILLCYLKLRKKTKEKSSFVIPSGDLLAVFLIVIYFLLLVKVFPSSLVKCLALVGLGFPFYFQIKLQTDKRFEERFKDYTASLLFRGIRGFSWAYSREAAEFLTTLARIKQEDVILDYGGNVMSKMKKLAEKAKVVVLDISKKQLAYKKEEMSKLVQLPNVIWVKEEKYVPFEEELFDVVLSIGGLNYTSKPGRIIKRLRDILKIGGRMVMIIVDNPILPAPYVIDTKDKIREEFKKYGFKETRIVKKKTLFSTYFIIETEK